jgi:hypothetical protein
MPSCDFTAGHPSRNFDLHRGFIRNIVQVVHILFVNSHKIWFYFNVGSYETKEAFFFLLMKVASLLYCRLLKRKKAQINLRFHVLFPATMKNLNLSFDTILVQRHIS